MKRKEADNYKKIKIWDITKTLDWYRGIIPMTQTRCYFGGYRDWFQCPFDKDGKVCGRRVGVLYEKDGLVGCRHCHNLTYSSCNKNRRDRHYSILRVIELKAEINQLKKDIKKNTYKGKLTKKERRLETLCKKALIHYIKHTSQDNGGISSL